MNGREGEKKNEKKKKTSGKFWRNKISVFLDNEIMVSCDEEMKLKVKSYKISRSYDSVRIPSPWKKQEAMMTIIVGNSKIRIYL